MADPLIELSGFHAVKHALRFGASVLIACTDDHDRVMELCEQLAPDLRDQLASVLTVVDTDELAGLSDYTHPTRLLGRAARPDYRITDLTAVPAQPVIHLHHPVAPGNVGAVIRVAAAVQASAVTVSGFDQLWSPACVRGSAGLHYAVPVLNAELDVVARDRPVVAFDPGGEPYRPATIPAGPVLAFGSERSGLTGAILQRADRVVRLPMADGVSSLNLATSVAAATYALACRAG